jgi:hypothetical protein
MRQKLFILILVLTSNLYSQENENKVFNSISISLNNSLIEKINFSKNYGFGIGLEHIFHEDKRINLFSGIEFNHTSQFYQSIYNGRFSTLYDVTYKMNFFTIPLGLRVNLIKPHFVSLNLGGYADFSLMSKYYGRSVYYNYSQIGTEYFITQTEFEEKNIVGDVFGVFTGINFQIPFNKDWIIIKTDLKLGVNH